jgi:ABC-2 type transport system ATP-binding protein
MHKTDVIEVEGLTHSYGNQTIYEDLNFTVPAGKIYGLLGKNGVGKTTLIQILMGFLRPVAGHCKVFGEDSHNLSPATRARIGLLFEGHIAYEFMSISRIERFYAPFYPRWNCDVFYSMVEKLGLSPGHQIRHMSCGQRSQVVLGLIMAQQADLLILDDYSTGLDAGYRRLFLDDLREYLAGGDRTVFLTSHVIQDMGSFVDEIIFIERGGGLRSMPLAAFRDDFRCFRVPRNGEDGIRIDKEGLKQADIIKNVEAHTAHWDIFSFAEKEQVVGAIREHGCEPNLIQEIPMSLEDAFIGYTGRY